VPESPAFVAFAVDLLLPLGPVRARAMFGGHGIYCGDLMIGLIDDDEIFLKTDPETRAAFEGAGCRRWVYSGGGKTMETSYFRPPDEAHESPEDMEPWGRLALEAALRAAKAKAARKARTGGKVRAKAKVEAKGARPKAKAKTKTKAKAAPRRPRR
jgi:DNA transformation protein and related proteins